MLSLLFTFISADSRYWLPQKGYSFLVVSLRRSLCIPHYLQQTLYRQRLGNLQGLSVATTAVGNINAQDYCDSFYGSFQSQPPVRMRGHHPQMKMQSIHNFILPCASLLHYAGSEHRWRGTARGRQGCAITASLFFNLVHVAPFPEPSKESFYFFSLQPAVPFFPCDNHGQKAMLGQSVERIPLVGRASSCHVTWQLAC